MTVGKIEKAMIENVLNYLIDCFNKDNPETTVSDIEREIAITNIIDNRLEENKHKVIMGAFILFFKEKYTDTDYMLLMARLEAEYNSK